MTPKYVKYFVELTSRYVDVGSPYEISSSDTCEHEIYIDYINLYDSLFIFITHYSILLNSFCNADFSSVANSS